jgi:radical S-adenosyl methionine domain-containing protein 2
MLCNTTTGGEPFLHPQIFDMIQAAKAVGLSTSVVTNGSCLNASTLLRLAGHLDWIAFSVDASDDALHAAMGRGLPSELQGCSSPQHLERILKLWEPAREMGCYHLKLNTVVSRANL